MNTSPTAAALDRPSEPPSPRILIVDDDETTRLLARAHLELAGFAVEDVAVAADLFPTLRRFRPDAIVLDIIMPDMDGFTACAALRRLPETLDTPILIMTSLDDTASVEKAFRAGATEFTAKPVNWATEVHRLHFMLRSAHAHAALHESREEWVRSFNAISDLVVVLDLECRVQRLNRAALTALGKTADQVVDQTCHAVFCRREAPRPDCPCLHLTTCATGEPAPRETVFPGCGDKPYLVSGAPLRDAGGNITGFVLTAKDISVTKAMEKQLLHAQKMEAVGTLAAGVAHEFNNILQVIVGNAGFLQGEESISPQNQECLLEIRQAAERGRTLTQQLLTASRKMREERLPLLLNSCVTEHQALIAHALPSGIQLKVQLATGLRLVKAASRQIDQILTNLTTNAVEAMGTQGALTLATANLDFTPDESARRENIAPGAYVQLSVTDTGRGMDATTLERIYEPFFTTKPDGEGTGLGLSVVYNLVKGHGGTITCESEPGHGTTFRILLPAATTVSAPVAGAVPASRQSLPAGRGETILLVDDEPNLVRVVARALTGNGYRVQTANDGEEALALYRQEGQHYDLVIIDLNMPRLSGANCLDKIRQHNPHAKVIVTTGTIGGDDRDRCRRDHGVTFLDKPYTIGMLLSGVRQALDAKTDQRSSGGR